MYLSPGHYYWEEHFTPTKCSWFLRKGMWQKNEQSLWWATWEKFHSHEMLEDRNNCFILILWPAQSQSMSSIPLHDPKETERTIFKFQIWERENCIHWKTKIHRHSLFSFPLVIAISWKEIISITVFTILECRELFEARNHWSNATNPRRLGCLWLADQLANPMS